ncbi:hypothetical protein GCM10022278_04780 [Allohahella marinimesophila]|uniref:Type II secretion system protein GspC N-terminal domain-containing protein n=1 Tax=Allohahella marinimesophila TaxID=1054972 RepID=A0ABP7NLN2_9GAMM
MTNLLLWTAIFLFVWLLGKWIWPVLYPDAFRPLVANFEQGRGGAEAIKANYAAWNLFGRKPAGEVRQEMAQVEVPETAMQLDLHGVVVGLDSRSSGAIISERNAEANYYRMDEELPGGVVLAAVYDDRVLLDRNGVMETLSFDKGATIKTMVRPQATQPPVASSGSPLPQSPEEFLSMAEQQLTEDAPAALASVGLEPAAAGGAAEGYRFTGGNPMLRSLNLQPGDVIRSINGHVLGNVQEDRRMMKEFHQSGMLEVEVERDGAVFSISYPIP